VSDLMLCAEFTCNLHELQHAANAPGACQHLSTALQTQVSRGCLISEALPAALDDHLQVQLHCISSLHLPAARAARD
jgi:hypothetical protein